MLIECPAVVELLDAVVFVEDGVAFHRLLTVPDGFDDVSDDGESVAGVVEIGEAAVTDFVVDADIDAVWEAPVVAEVEC